MHPPGLSRDSPVCAALWLAVNSDFVQNDAINPCDRTSDKYVVCKGQRPVLRHLCRCLFITVAADLACATLFSLQTLEHCPHCVQNFCKIPMIERVGETLYRRHTSFLLLQQSEQAELTVELCKTNPQKLLYLSVVTTEHVHVTQIKII